MNSESDSATARIESATGAHRGDQTTFSTALVRKAELLGDTRLSKEGSGRRLQSERIPDRQTILKASVVQGISPSAWTSAVQPSALDTYLGILKTPLS